VPRSIYFSRYSTDSLTSKDIEDLFLKFITDHKLSFTGDDDSLEGFMFNNVTNKPIVKNQNGHIDAEYGIERIITIERLNGETETYHIPRKTIISLDVANSLMAIFTSREEIANSLFEKIKMGFTDLNKIKLERIKYNSEFIHWLVNNATKNSKVLIEMNSVKTEKDEEIVFIRNEGDINDSNIYKIIESSDGNSFQFVDGKALIQTLNSEKKWITWRVYENGKLTLNTNAYETAKIIHDDILNLNKLFFEQNSENSKKG
jgi:hypothetical protein